MQLQWRNLNNLNVLRHLSETKLQNLEVMLVKFMFSKKATKIYEIFIVDLTLCSKFQIDGEDFFNFCGLLRKHELYWTRNGVRSVKAENVKKIPCTYVLKNYSIVIQSG